MGKFLNKSELIIIVLLILLFDFNGFCDTSLNHIMYGRRRHTWIFLIAVVFILYDIFVFHMIVNHEPIPDVQFGIESDSKAVTCEDSMEEQIGDQQKKIDELEKAKKRCPAKEKEMEEEDKANNIIETLVLNFIVIVMISMVMATVSVSGGEGVNRKSKRFILSIPILIVAILLFFYANVYRYS